MNKKLSGSLVFPFAGKSLILMMMPVVNGFSE
jgi:hypothetical protein